VARDLVGTVLDGRYEILEPLAEGGMGTVYVGRQLNIDRKVAIKVMLHSAAENADLASRFESEAKIISELRHPNTLKLIDYGRVDGRLYLVTELLSGRPLSARIAEGPLDQEEALEIIREVCLSLEEAHAKGIVHRDLKPANIFLETVGAREVVKVLDFGIAKIDPNEAFTGGQTPKTASGTIVGTPAYMSPEVADGRPVDARSDLYSLGVVAYECLAGKVPFVGTPIAQIAGHGFDRPKAPSEVAGAPRLDPAVERLVMRLLEKDPSSRPQSAEELVRAIDRVIASLEPSAADPGSSRWRIWIGLGVALAAGVMLVPSAIDTGEVVDGGAPIEVEAPDAAIASVPDAGLDFGAKGVSVTPSLRGAWTDPDAVLAILRGLTPAILACYGLIELKPAPTLVVRFSVSKNGTSVSVTPKSDDAEQVRRCFALGQTTPIAWPGTGTAMLWIAPE
jgi:serine/threonine-protein kinase